MRDQLEELRALRMQLLSTLRGPIGTDLELHLQLLGSGVAKITRTQGLWMELGCP